MDPPPRQLLMPLSLSLSSLCIDAFVHLHCNTRCTLLPSYRLQAALGHLLDHPVVEVPPLGLFTRTLSRIRPHYNCV